MLLSLEQIAGRCRLKMTNGHVLRAEKREPGVGDSTRSCFRETEGAELGEQERRKHNCASRSPLMGNYRELYSMAKMARTVTPFSMRRGLIERGSEALASLCMAIMGMGRVVLDSLSFEA